mmetsp:Transcript_31868/g.34237  ORF Transcript_31868/g.34237 Transcript_31868/m.34237 type:complete len:219 (+) Transcript_31868:122-778(+)
MYDTATAAANDIPLHGSSEGMLSSLSLSAFMIQRPEPDVSFSWSDFPMVVKEDNKHKRYASSSSSSSSGCSMSNHSHSSSTLSDFSSTSSSMNLLDESTSSSSTRTRDLSSRRNVHFSQHLAVRTYSLVLGDHPLGSNGLAIEHGWDYDSHEGEKVDMQLREDWKHTTNWSRQRSHLEKKRLLLEVAGCSKQELNQRTTTYQEEQRAAAAQPWGTIYR